MGSIKQNISQNLLWVLLSGLLFGCTYFFAKRASPPRVTIDLQEASLTPRPMIIKLAGLGLKRAVADIFWVKTLMDSDLEHYKKRDLNSWMYLRFNTIADLDPLFVENYIYGGQYLSIVKDDIPGATKLYNRGLVLFPDNYDINLNFGFHLLFEKVDPIKALNLLKKLISHPKNPVYFNNLLITLHSKYSSNKEALDLANYLWLNTKDEKLRKNIESKIKKIMDGNTPVRKPN